MARPARKKIESMRVLSSLQFASKLGELGGVVQVNLSKPVTSKNRIVTKSWSSTLVLREVWISAHSLVAKIVRQIEILPGLAAFMAERKNFQNF